MKKFEGNKDHKVGAIRVTEGVKNWAIKGSAQLGLTEEQYIRMRLTKLAIRETIKKE